MLLIDSKPFWREKPLSDDESELLHLLFKAHDASVYRPNLSSETVVKVCIGAGEYLKAIPAAMLTLGGLHGPIIQAHALLNVDQPYFLVQCILKDEKKVPGWGNSFAKGHKDPVWMEVDNWMRLNAGDVYDRICSVTRELHSHGKSLYPNPACYTAAAAIILGIPGSVAPWLFIQGRLAGWTLLALNNL